MTKSLSIESSTDVVITKIVFTYSGANYLIQQSNLTAPTSGYTVSETTGIWQGSQSVSKEKPFTWTWNTDKPRFTTIEITYTTGTAVLNESDLAHTAKYTYESNNAWTPAVKGTIEVSDLVTSSSTGAYSITSGTDVATISGTTITALKAGDFTLSQAADDKYKAGSKVITVRIGQDVTSDGSKAYSFTAETNVSDGMKIARQNITMTFGADGFWKKPFAKGYTQGQNTPVVSNNIPKRGTFYKFNATSTGSLKVTVKLNALNGKLRPLYVSENGTLVKAKDKNGTELDPNNMPETTANSYEDFITFPVKANTDYYVYVTSSKLGFYGFTFEPATLYTVTFNAGTNGTCSTTSLMQESAGATITLPEVTPKTGYKFDGWYTEGGDKVTSPYKPESSDITLYAHYISTVSTSVVATFENPTKTTWNEKNQNGFTITGVSNTKTDGSAKLSSGGSITLNIPEGYTVTGFDFTLLCANTSEGSTLSVGDDEISVYDGTHTLHKMNLSSSVTGSTTLTITNSGAKELNIESIKVYGSNAKSISFTTHPLDAEYVKDATSVKALTVAAKVNNVTGDTPSISYHWFWNNTKSTDGGTAINDQESSTSCIPGVSTPGTKYYYCKATATVGEETLEAYSNIATVTVSNPTLTIVTQPVGATYAKDQTGVAKLMVVAETNSGEEIKYQWYSKNTESAEFSPINNATSSEYLPPVDEAGTKYYYCEVKVTLTSETLTANTKTVIITVNNDQPIYGYKVSKAGDTAPGINSSKYINTKTDGTGENLVKMTFGGWKWNGGKYTKPGSDTEIADTWKTSETVSGVTVLDGYQYWFSGTQDAKQEDKDAETEMYGQTRYGWFVSPTRVNGITTDSHPYTLPVRGSFMTFEPTKNGTLTIYILQNGAWNTFDKDTQLDGVSYKKGDIKPGEFRMHAFQITNQRGLVLAEFAPKYSVTNNQKVDAAYSCTKYLEKDKPTSFNKTSKDVSDWEEFWALTQTERQAVKENWSVESNGGCQEIIKLENGSFLAIQKAVVKYQFHVTGNETYYLFSNFSKMGFSGATFQPDAAQPTDEATFSGAKSLSDTKAYTPIKMESDGTTIGETGLTNYKYTINGEEVGKVDGVFIPQFKKITLKRTFKPKQWTTLSLPFNLTQTEVEQIFGKGTQIIVFDKAEPTSARIYLTFFYHEIQNVLPGYPYLIRPTLEYDNNNSNSAYNAPTHTIDGGNLTEFTVYNKAINPAIKQHEFKSGDYTAKCTPSYCTADVSGNNNSNYSMQYEKGDIFVSEGNGTVYISAGSSYGKGYRSYIDYTGTTTPPSAKALSISFSGVEDDDDNGTTTDIRIAELADDVIETLGIGGVYNLNGQKVADTTRNLPAGIYIVNGRKVVVK